MSMANMLARAGAAAQQGARRSRTAPALPAVGIQGFAAGNYYAAGAGVWVPGDAGGFGIAVALHVLAVPSGSEFIFTSGNGSTRGFLLRTSGTSLRFDAASGAGSIVSSPTSEITAGDVGKTILVVGMHSGSHIRLYRAGVQIGSGTAITGYTEVATGQAITLGVSTGLLNPATSFRIIGAACFEGVPSGSDITAWGAATEAAASVQSMGGAGVVTTDRWQAADNDPPGATWAADVGGKSLSRTGSGLTAETFTPDWE